MEVLYVPGYLFRLGEKLSIQKEYQVLTAGLRSYAKNLLS
jgi:hypothetical protein